MADDDSTRRRPVAGAEVERIRAIVADYEAAALPAPSASSPGAGTGGRPSTTPVGRLATKREMTAVVDRAITEVEAELRGVHDLLAELQAVGALAPEHEPLLERASTTLDILRSGEQAEE